MFTFIKFLGETCTNPSATTLTYTSRNVALSAQTAYVAEVYLKCKEEHSSLDLFAEIEPGVITPVASIPDKESYQVKIYVLYYFGIYKNENVWTPKGVNFEKLSGVNKYTVSTFEAL